MFARFNTLLSRVLPTLAVVMLTAGPASAAAEAAYRGRVAERTLSEKVLTQPATAGKPFTGTTRGSDSAPKRSKPSKHDADGVSAYLVPAVAKPSEAKSTDYLAACATAQSSSRAAEQEYSSCTQPTETPLKQLHCPAYLAQAPPLIN